MSLPLPPSVPLVYSGTTVNTGAVTPHILFLGYELWLRPLGPASANALIKHFIIIVLSLFSFLARTTQATKGRRITQFTELSLAR